MQSYAPGTYCRQKWWWKVNIYKRNHFYIADKFGKIFIKIQYWRQLWFKFMWSGSRNFSFVYLGKIKIIGKPPFSLDRDLQMKMYKYIKNIVSLNLDLNITFFSRKYYLLCKNNFHTLLYTHIYIYKTKLISQFK